MKNRAEKLDRPIGNTGFGALLCFALGFFLLEAWMVRLGSKPVAHAVLVSVGTLVASVLYRTSARHASAAVQSTDTCAAGHGGRSGTGGLACGALLLMFGCIGALALSSGSMTLLAIFVCCACAFPWSKIALCRTSRLVPVALVTVANVLGVLTTDQPPSPLHAAMAVWMLWMGAVGTWFMNILYRRQKSRASKLPYQSTEEPAEAMQA